jgi:hypothetical protein
MQWDNPLAAPHAGRAQSEAGTHSAHSLDAMQQQNYSKYPLLANQPSYVAVGARNLVCFCRPVG